MPAVPWAQWNCLEQNKSVASMCKVMVNKMGVYLKKNPTLKQNKKKNNTLEKLFPDYGMTDLYFSRWTLLSKKTEQHKICFEISIKTVTENVTFPIIEQTLLARQHIKNWNRGTMAETAGKEPITCLHVQLLLKQSAPNWWPTLSASSKNSGR